MSAEIVICVLTCMQALPQPYADRPPGCLDITLTVLQDEVIDYSQQILGLSWDPSPPWFLAFVSKLDHAVYYCDPDGFAFYGTVVLPAENDNAFDAAPCGQWDLYTNDAAKDSLYPLSPFEDPAWNPAGPSGRGLDTDQSGFTWEAVTDGTIIRFLPGRPAWDVYDVSGIVSSEMSGLACFEIRASGERGVVVTCSLDHSFYFFRDTGAGLDLIGSAPCPADCIVSTGIAYGAGSGTFFWSYMDASGFRHIAEMEVDLQAMLSQETWGFIKSDL